MVPTRVTRLWSSLIPFIAMINRGSRVVWNCLSLVRVSVRVIVISLVWVRLSGLSRSGYLYDLVSLIVVVVLLGLLTLLMTIRLCRGSLLVVRLLSILLTGLRISSTRCWLIAYAWTIRILLFLLLMKLTLLRFLIGLIYAVLLLGMSGLCKLRPMRIGLCRNGRSVTVYVWETASC